MKRIQFKVTWCDREGVGVEQLATVTARDLNSGFRKAVADALKQFPDEWTLHSVEFWMVLS